MQIWIAEDGEKRGPFHTYEVRARIEAGELTGDELAWQEGSADWVALRDMELYQSLFSKPEPEVVVPPPLPPPRPRPFARLWARWFDLLLYLVLVFGLMRVLQLDMAAAVVSPWFMLTYLLPWVLLEAIALHQSGTTPGKWLLGVRVELAGSGGLLPLGVSVRRSFRVFVLGMGMNMWLFPILCHGLSLWVLLKTGTTFWDRVSGSRVRVGEVPAGRIVAFVILFLALLVALQFIMAPVTEEIMDGLLESQQGSGAGGGADPGP